MQKIKEVNMNRKHLAAVLTIPAIVVAFALWPTAADMVRNVTEVFVTNFPDDQKIHGSVTVDNPVRLSKQLTMQDFIVVPVLPDQTTRLIDAGTLETDGFSNVVFSLVGMTKAQVDQPGEVGAILIPDQETVQNAFHEKGQFLFPMTVTAEAGASKSPYFASNQPKFRIGFSSYKVFLFNTTNKSVEVDLYAYLTN